MEKRVTIGVTFKESTKKNLTDLAKRRSMEGEQIVTVSMLIRDAIEGAYGSIFKSLSGIKTQIKASDDPFDGGVDDDEDG